MIRILILLIYLFSFELQAQNDYSIEFYDSILKNKTINEAIISLKQLNSIRFKTNEMEEEEVKWKVIELYRKHIKFGLVEASWESDTIKRITLFQKGCFSTNTFPKIIIGEKVSRIIRFIDFKKLNYSPDGYLFLQLKNNKRMSIEVNIDRFKKLGYNASNINKFKDKLYIESIIISY